MKQLCFVWLMLCVGWANAQTDPLYSHYMFNPAYYNPGWMGNINVAQASLHHRSQWAGYGTSFDGSGGAPTSQLLSMAVPIEGFLHSVGTNVSLDNIGPESTFRMQLGASYSFGLNPGTISVGIMPALISRTIKYDLLRFEDQNDPLNIGSRESQTKLDAAAGVFYQDYSGFFVGVGIDHILRPSLIQVSEGSGGRLDRVFYFHGGYPISLNRDLDLTPTALIKTNLNSYSFDVSGVLTFRDIMWGGLSFRQSEALILLLGYSFLDNNALKVGYSFDYVAQNQEAKGRTSHEVYIGYTLPSLVLGGRKAVKTPRFSF